MKDELTGKIMTEFFALTLKAYYYLMDGGSKHKRTKETKTDVEFKNINAVYLKMA